jgi:hypothetical protein
MTANCGSVGKGKAFAPWANGAQGKSSAPLSNAPESSSPETSASRLSAIPR